MCWLGNAKPSRAEPAPVGVHFFALPLDAAAFVLEGICRFSPNVKLRFL